MRGASGVACGLNYQHLYLSSVIYHGSPLRDPERPARTVSSTGNRHAGGVIDAARLRRDSRELRIDHWKIRRGAKMRAPSPPAI